MEELEQSRGFILFREENKKPVFLLLRYKAGHWDFPRGHVEKGEEELVAAKRELEEETSISQIQIIEGFSYEYSYKFFNNQRQKKVILLLAKTSQKDVVLSHEHIDFKWLDFENALKLITYEHPKLALKKAYEFLQKLSN